MTAIETRERCMASMASPDASLPNRPLRREPAPESGGEFVEYAPGQVIFQKGDGADRLLIILEGSVEIFDPAEGAVIAVLGKGASFGEQAILEGGVRNESARTVDSTTCLEIGTDPLRALLDADTGLLKPVVESLFLQLCMANSLSRLISSSAQADCSFEVAGQRNLSTIQGERKLGQAYARVGTDHKGLTSEEMLLLKLQASHRLNSGIFDAGQKLTDQSGGGLDSAFVILEGEVQAVSKIQRYRLGTGSVLGLAEALSNTPFVWTLSARNNVTVLVLPIARILHGIAGINPGIRGILRYSSARIIELQRNF